MSATQQLINRIIEELEEEGPIVVVHIDVLAGYFNKIRSSAVDEFAMKRTSVPDRRINDSV